MNYEEKYKNALERAKEFYVLFEDTFPKFKESEDERTRKSILSGLKYLETELGFDAVGDVDILDAYAWLEKQGTSYTKRDVDDAYLKGISDAKNEIEKQYKADYQIRKDIATFIFNYRGDIKDRAKWMDYLGIKAYFVGDWVVRGDTIAQILDIQEQYYIGIDINGKDFTSSKFLNDDKIHLWTIEDAKDGDVLASDKSIFIFQEEYIAEKPIAYCGLMNGLFIKGEDACWTNEKCHPATKEQRDILFSKMKEAGYEWDAEKKELKKIHNALEECEIGRIEHGKYYYCIKDYYSGGCKRASKGEVVQALSGMSMMALGVKANEYFIPVKCIIDVSPAWSEEDEKKLIKVISIVQNVSSYDNQLDGYIEWLKSLRPQNLWKPSDEQIKAIRLARSFVVDDFSDHPTLSEILMELEEQLQKIKEE